jgi:hypothetical protein
VAQSTGQEAFAATGGPSDQDIFSVLQVATFGECSQLLFGKVARSAAFDLFVVSGRT